MENTSQQSENLRKTLIITEKLEKAGKASFRKINTKKDNKEHKAIVSDGLIIVDNKYEMTWDSFTYLYLSDIVNQDEYVKIVG